MATKKTTKTVKPASKRKAAATSPPPVTAVAAPALNKSIVTDANFSDVLMQWQGIRQQLESFAALAEQEMELRRAIVAHTFGEFGTPREPNEGMNRLDLGAGWRLEATCALDRKIDEAALPAVEKQLPEGSMDFLLRWKPELQTTVYKEMPSDLRTIMDQCVITKPKAPSLKLVAPE